MNTTPLTYEMTIIKAYHPASNGPEFLIMMAQTAFKSVKDFEDFIASNLKPGSTIKWTPGCDRMQGEPFSTANELETFKEFCLKNKINFIYTPSG